MAGINNSGWTGEGMEANVNANPNESQNKYAKLIKWYVKERLNNTQERLWFAKYVTKANTISDDMLQEIEAYRASKTEFSGLDINTDSIKLWDIQRELWSFLAGIESQKATLRSTFLQEYDIDASEYTKNISWKIDNISSEIELQELQGSDIVRDEFLAKIYKKGSPKRRLVSHILQDMGIEKRYEDLEDHLQKEFMTMVWKFKRRENLEISDIMPLFETDIFSVKEKAKIIETFMPSISIADGIKLGIFTVMGANKIKKQALQNALDTGLFKWVNLDGYIHDIKNEELIVSTQGLFDSEESQEKLFEQNFFFEKFKADFDAMLQKIEDDLASKSIQTAGEMQEILSGAPHVSGIDNFKEWGIIVIKQNHKDEVSGETKEVTLYAEIVSLASAGTFVIKEQGVDIYDTAEDKTSRQTYSQFINFATKGNIPNSIEFISSETLDHRVRTGEIKDKNFHGKFEDKSELSWEIKELTKQIEAREKQLQKQGVPKAKWEEDEKIIELQKMRDGKNTLRDSIEWSNLKALQSQIDELDPDGKEFKFEAGTSFISNWWNGDIFSVTHIDEVNQVVIINGLVGSKRFSYVEFIESYENENAKRVSHINNFWELFTQSDAVYKSWQWFEFKDGKIANKNSPAKIDYNYLVPSSDAKDQELIKIHSIDNAMATISFWEASSKSKKDKNGNKSKEETFATESEEYTVSIWVLDHYIRKNKLEIRSLEEWKIAEEEKKWIPKPEETFGIANWFFQGMSISAAIKWWHTAIEQITNILNEWDDEKANHFALKTFWPFLWEDGKTDLMARVEQTQKKSMDEMLDRLKAINSKPATTLIRNWLLDPRTPEYKKEAGMFFMMEKYGALCAKELYQYQGQYFWYQKMWGKIWDEVWVKVHADNNREPKQNTTEEQLVYMLMKKQTGKWWFNGIQRRSKLDKELKAMRWKGKEEEYDTGVKDGGNERDLQDRLIGGLSELSSWNYPNAFGWLETVINKGGTMAEMNMIPFVTVVSWMAYKFEKDILDKIKNFPADSRMIMMLRMMSYSGDIDLLNDTIMELAVRLNKKPKYRGILAWAEKLRDMRANINMSERDKQNYAKEFYENYGEVLTNAMYMLNTGNEDDVDNKIIFFEKDTCSTFQNYYAKLEGYVNADGDFGKNEGLMADAFAGAGTSGIDIYRATKQMLELRTGWAWAKHESGPIMWKEIQKEFEAIPKRQYDPDPVKNEQMQRKLLDSNLRKFLAAIVSLNTDTRATSSYNAPTWFFSRLNDWWVYFDDVINAGANAEAIKGWEHKVLINKFIDGIMNYSQHGTSLKRPTRSDGKWGFEYIKEWEWTSPLSVSDLIQGKTQNIIQTGAPVNTDSRPNA